MVHQDISAIDWYYDFDHNIYNFLRNKMPNSTSITYSSIFLNG